MSPAVERPGGRILVDQLRLHGVDTVFCVPGESFLEVLDALYEAGEAVRLVVCRQEGGAAAMAGAYGRVTGRPGVCLVSRAPGATNAASGVDMAFRDAAPMLLVVGLPPRPVTGRGAFQELDVGPFFGQMAKWAARVDDPARLPELVARAFQVATSGRQGPVVLGVPEDVLAAGAAVADARVHRPVQPQPDAADLDRLAALLAAARRPLVLAGGGGWTAAASADLRAFAEASELPVAASWRSQDVLDNRSPSYAGHAGLAADPRLADRVRTADLLVAVGPRLGELTTGGYRLLDAPRPRQTLVHVHPDVAELGRVYQPDLPVNAGVAGFAAALRALPPVTDPPWSAWTRQAHRDYLAWSEPPPGGGRLDLARVVAVLRQRLPADAIVANGAGNYTIWLHRFWRYTALGTQLGPRGGAMGYGLPAALAAKLACPDRPVVAVTGDGDFLMTGQELATAVRHALPVLVVLVNNGLYGTIRMHQERAHPGRVVGTDLVNPDFAALARAYGAHGEVVERTDEFQAALDRALASAGPALLELRADPDLLRPPG
jgi:acetolactate synthase I/II/III large subunit